MSTTGHESEVVQVQGLKASLKKGGNKGIFNEAICSTAGATAAKVTNTTPPSFTLTSGATIIVKFTYAISVASATLKVGDADAKPIYYQGSALGANKVKAGTSLLLRYNGTVWNIIGMLGSDSAAAYTPTLSSAPTSSTTTYTKDGETLPFEIGQFCRVADVSMDTGYKFYQLADLSNGVAAWQEMGTALERVTISVTSNQAASVTSTLRSSAVITVEDEDGQQVYSGTMPQSTMVKMTPGKRYTISAGSVSGFTAPQPQTIDAEYEGVHSIDMEYQTELVSVSLSKNTGSGDLSGVGITIKDSSDNTLGSGTGSITDLTVAYGTQYHVVLTDNPDHYIAPDTSSVYTAGQASRSIALQYTEYSQGQVTVVPTAKTLTYSGEAQELVTAGQGTGTMMYKLGDGSWSSSIPTATAAGSYEVKYKAAAAGTYYESAEGTVSVSIAKAYPTYTAPTAKSGLVYSGEAQALLNAGSTTDGEISYSSDGSTWGQNIPTATDANDSISVYWKLTGDSNHNDVASTLINVGIAKADITPYVSMAGWTYGGTASNPSVSGNTGGGEVSYLYKVQGASDSTYTTGKPSAAGDYTIKAEIAATSNCNAGTATADFTIAKAVPSYTAPTGKSLTYNGSGQDLLNAGSTSDGTMKYSLNGTSWSENIPQGKNAGEYTLYWKVEGDSNHSDIASTEVSASVAKVTPTVIIPTAKVLVYNTSAQELVNAGSTNYGTLKYSLDGTTYSTSIPTATDYGTYTVYYKVEGDSNVNSVAAATVACSISEKEVSAPTIELTPSSYTYSGSACTPTVVVKDGSHIIPSSEYTVTFSNNTNAGTATVTIADNTGGNYNITGSTTFNIAKADPTCTAPTAKAGLVYDNTDKALLNAASNVVGGTVKYSSDGTSWGTTIPTGKNAGSYSPQWKIEGDSNHNDKAAAAISVSIAKVTPTVTAPTAKTLTYTGSAQTLANAGSTNWGTLQYSADGSTWGTGIPTGTNASTSYKVYYRVVGDSNINDVAAQSINCSIGKAAPTYTAPTAKTGLVYTGSAQALLNAGSTSHGTIQYSSDNSNWSSTIPSQTNANTSGYTSYWRLVGDSNHSDVASSSLKTTIAKANISASVSMSGWTYGSTANNPSVSGNSGSGSVAYTYKVSGAADSTYTSTKPSNAGSYVVRAVIDATSNYNGTTVTNTFSISKVTPTVTAPTAKSLTYNGSAQTLANAGSTNYGTLQYSADNSTWGTTIPTGTNASTGYKVYYRVVGNSNVNDVASANISVTIARANLSASVSMSGWTYGGTASNPSVSGNSGSGSVTYNYKVSGAADSTYSATKPSAAGTYTVRAQIAETTNYNAATVTTNFTISKANLSASVSMSGWTYGGTATSPSVSGNSGSGSVTYTYKVSTASDSTYSSTKPSAAGTYTVRAQIAETSNYNGATVTNNFTISKANLSASVSMSGWTYGGTANNPSVSGNSGSGSVTYTYKVSGAADSTYTSTKPSNAGTYVVRAVIAETSNYNGATVTNSFTISKANLSASVSMSGWTYGGTASSPSVSGNSGSGSVAYTYKVSGAADSTYTSTKPSNAGTYVVRAVIDATSNYNGTTVTNTFTIAKASQNAPTATGASVSYGNTATATASGGGGQGSIEWSNGNTLSGNVGSKTTKARWSGNSNYNASAWSNEVTLAITKIDPTITAPTAKSGLTYSGSSQTLYNAGSNTTAGSFSYTDGTRTNAGSQTVSWSFTPTDTTNYNSKSGSFTGSIAQATGSASVSGRSLSYSRGSQNLVSVSSNTGTMHYRVGTSGSWTTTIPTSTNCGSWTIYYYMDASTNYTARGSSSSPWGSVSASIAKVTPVLSTSPTKTADWTYNGSSKALASGGAMKHSSSDSTAVAGTFSYGSGQNAGSYTATWSFTPTDTTNYNSTSGNVGTVTVSKATGSTGCSGRSLTYSRGSQNLISVSGNTGTNHYKVNNGSWGTSIPTATDAGTYTIYVYTDTSTNYNAVGSSSSPSSYTTTIAKVTPVLSTSPTKTANWTYNGSSKALASGGAMKHSSSDSTAVAGTFSYATGQNAGSYTATWSFTPTNTTNYNSTSGNVGTVTVSKATGSTGCSGRSLTYSRGAQSLLSVSGNTGTNHYRYKYGSGSYSSWSTTAPTATNAGTYTIQVYTDTSTNYNAVGSSSSPSSYTTTIAKVTPVLSTSPSYRTGLTYNGSAQNLMSGGAMKFSSSDSTAVAGTFTYDQGTNAGTYSSKKWYFTPTDTTNYNSTNGTLSGSCTIAKKSRTISFTTAPSEVEEGSSITVAASVSEGSGDGAISFSSGDTAKATVSGSTITGVAEGTVTIYANVAEGTNYTSASTSYTLSVISADFVDLGLSVKWAKGNICKDSSNNYYIGEPTDKGCYYSWGNILGHNKGEGYNFNSSTYNGTPGKSLTGNIASNDASHDAALACLGTGKRMPTKAEFDELINNCTVTWVTSYNGVSVAGRVFKSKKTGYTDKEIFIPASGRYSGTALSREDENGYYWSSTYFDSGRACYLNFYSGNVSTSGYDRSYGVSVRAVQ